MEPCNEGEVGATGAIAVDSSGNVYITGNTLSTDFPTTLNVLQPSLAGGVPNEFCGAQDAFVTKIRLPVPSEYSTYLGGTGLEEAHGIAVDSMGVPI